MFQVLAFIRYWLLQADEHSLHSPYVFNLYNEVIKTASSNKIQAIENLRAELLNNSQELILTDFGAGSRVNSSSKRTVAEIAKNSGTPAKFSALLSELIAHFGYKHILELGTSLGLNTLYLSQHPETQVTSFEGDTHLVQLAQKHFSQLNRNNISIVEGHLDETLEKSLEHHHTIDLAYLDANHRYEPSLRYYELIRTKCHEKSMIVLDDIHWSKEMHQAWNEIKSRPEVIVSIDLFEGGLLFFDPKLTPGDYVLRF